MSFTREALRERTRKCIRDFFESEEWEKHLAGIKANILQASDSGGTETEERYSPGLCTEEHQLNELRRVFPDLTVTHVPPDAHRAFSTIIISWE